jgi:hypothetical protein
MLDHDERHHPETNDPQTPAQDSNPSQPLHLEPADAPAAVSQEETDAPQERSEPTAGEAHASDHIPADMGEAHAESHVASDSEPPADSTLTEEAALRDAEPSVQAQAELAAEAARWGYVADDGTIRLRATETSPERTVGTMKGQNPDAALAFFGLKLRQIADKVAALERDWEHQEEKTRFLGRIQTLLGWVPGADALGDLEGLTARLERLRAEAQTHADENLRRKEELCARAEQLRDSTDWKSTAEAIKALQAEWKTIGPVVPREHHNELWERFRSAGNHFFERRHEHFERIETEHKENLRIKEDLCVRAEALATRVGELGPASDWKATAEGFKALQAEWKAAGPLPKAKNDALWDRFRKANDLFFDRRQAHFADVDREHQENLQRKLALCEKAEELAASDDWKETTEAFKALQAEWKTLGPVPKDQNDAVWERFRKSADTFFERRQERFGQLEKDQKENLRRKQALVEEAEKLSTSLDFKVTSEALKALQAQWKAVGPVPRAKGEALWERFRKANDQFFERRSAYFSQRDQERERNREEWLSRLRESHGRKQEQISRMRETIAHDEEVLRRGANPDVERRLASKRSRLEELQADLREIETKLAEPAATTATAAVPSGTAASPGDAAPLPSDAADSADPADVADPAETSGSAEASTAPDDVPVEP